MKLNRLVVLGAVACLAMAAAVMGQDTPTSKASTDVSGIVAPVKLSKAQFDELVKLMEKVATAIEKQDAESAKAIRAAMTKAGEEFISDNMGEVVKLLNESLLKASKKEADIQKSLDEVLRILREGAIDPNAREKYLEWLKKMKEDIGKMIEQQKDLEKQSAETMSPASKEMADLMKELEAIVKNQENMLDQTQKLGEPDAEIKKLADARDKIDELLEKQEKLNDATDKAPIGERPAIGKAQDKLGEQAQQLKDVLDNLAKDDKVGSMLEKTGAGKEAVSKASEKTGQAKGEMSKASDALSKSDANKAGDPQKQATIDLKDAKKALEDAIAKAGEKTPAGEMAKEQQKLADQTAKLGDKVEATAAKAGQKASGANMQSASGQMSKASQQMSGQNSPKAADHQKKALEELKAKKTELAQLQRKIDEKKPTTPADQKPKQDEITQESEKANEEMKKQGEKMGQESPGQQNMQNASKNSSKASQGLSQNKPDDANKDQKKTLDDLQKAQDELDKAIAEEEDKKDEDKLAQIDKMLTDMLEKQRVISGATSATYAKRTGEKDYGRQETIQLTAQSDGEGKLSEDNQKVLKLLDDEKKSVVFPVILRDVNDKLLDTQKKLADKEAGVLTQATQAEIEQSLDDLINAVRKQLAEHRLKKKGGGGGQGGQGGGGKPPLVPPLAELKMLLTKENQLVARTKVINAGTDAGKITKDQAAAEHKKLSDDQKKVQKLTDDLKAKLK